MSAEPARLSDIAARVADGAAIDWDRAGDAGDPEERRLVGHLRLVDSIAGLYRSIPDDSAVPEIDDATGSISGEAWGPLVILEQLGRGASCEVMRAFEKSLHREVALKLFHPGEAAAQRDGRCLAEARRLARIRHPNVVQVYGAEQHAGRAGIWMELVRGESLDAVLAGRGRLGASEAALIGQELCQALSAVHGAGLVHRDIKAQNVVREAGGRIVLMDFGTGQDLRHGVSPVNLAGTPLYLAPEIFAGKPATVRSDIYSLGVLLFHLVTGQFPIAAATVDELRRRHAAGERRRLLDLRPDLPAGFVAVVERALASDPVDRYATAGALGAALHEWVHTRPVPIPAPRPWPRLWSRATIVLGLGILAVAVAAAVMWPRLTTAPPDIRSVVVLPLVDLSSGKAPSDFVNGLHVQLIDTLGQVSTLTVPSRTSSIAVGGGSRTIDEIASTLRVQAVVEGTVTVTDAGPGTTPEARLGIRLIAAGSEDTLLSQYFVGPIGDAVRLQADAAIAIASRLDALKDGVRQTGGLFRQGVDQAATESFVRGQAALARYGTVGARQALDAFTRAFTIDPQYAAAYAGAARANIALGFNQAITQESARIAAFDLATRALAINPDLADGHAVLGDVAFYYDWDLQQAGQHYQQALRLNASSVEAQKNYTDLLSAEGRLADAVTEAARLVDLEPQSADAAVALGYARLYNREYAAAATAFDRALELNGSAVGALIGKGRVAESQRRFTEALAFTEDAMRRTNGGGVPLWIQRACLLAKAGRVTEARAAMADIEHTQAQRGLTVAPEYRAYLHVALGENDEALTRLEEAVGGRSPSVRWMASDPRLEPVRSDPRFKILLTRLNP